jgi:hypothetical protein
MLISKSAVSENTDRLWEDYHASIARGLSEIVVEYLFVNAMLSRCAATGPRRLCWLAGQYY